MNEPRLNLFVSGNDLYETTDGGREEHLYTGPWPITVWFTAVDFRDGNGWGRNKFEKHGKILEHYAHDVGSGDETEAVLVEVPTLPDLLALVEDHDLRDEVPARL